MRLRVTAFAFFLTVLSAIVDAAEWQAYGPWLGQEIWGSAGDPHGAAVYVQTQSGLFRSSDSGATWKIIAAHNLGIAIDPTDSSILYAGSSSLGEDLSETYALVRSMDGGNTWATLLDGEAPPISADPNGTLWAWFYPGVLMTSADHGGTWSQVQWSNGSPRRISFAGTRQVLIVTSTARLFGSVDRGKTWTNLGTSLPSPVSIAAGSPDGTIFAGTETNGIYRSTDAGATWKHTTGIDATPYLDQIVDITVDPQSYRSVYALMATSGVIRSTDGGVSWQRAEDSVTAPGGAGLGHILVPAEGEDAVLVVGRPSVGGVLRSVDGGRHWSESNHGIYSLGFYDVRVDSAGRWIDQFHSSYGVRSSDDGGATWTMTSIPYASLFARHWSIPQLLAVAHNSGLMLRNADGEWSSINDPVPGAQTWALGFDPTSSSTLYVVKVSGGDRDLYRTTDLGATWHRLSALYLTDSATILVDPSAPQTLYAGPYMSTDGGLTWDQHDGEAQLILPGHPSTVYLSESQRILYAESGATELKELGMDGLPPQGGSWTIKKFDIDPLDGRMVLGVNATTTRSWEIFTSADEGKHWTRFDLPHDLIGSTLYGLTVRNHVLYVTTYHGLFSAQLVQPSRRRAVVR